ncbi:Hypothetical_protein [Hexamita inflata]|uniref:Hypothetical_protein n=1 Tax=Hexamita inflata TaxID=28002 RepID=A0AA86QCN0_9EUKA|nr:Hypothetical protein HINF_LOCUS40103 [Hexamita inflata]
MRMRKMKQRQSSQESEQLSLLQELLKQQINERIRENERIKNLQNQHVLLQQNRILTRIYDANEKNNQLNYNIAEQRMINIQAVEKLYNNEVLHIMKYVNSPEVQEFFFDLNNAQQKQIHNTI